MTSRFIKSILLLVIAVSFFVVFIMVTLIIQNYTDTKQWDTNHLNKEIHNTPPQLAKNYVSLDDQHLLELLSGVNGALSEIEKNESLDPDKLDDYRHLHENASKLQSDLELEDSELTEPVQTLGLYIDIEQAMKSAYKKPNPERLASLTDKLSERILNNSKREVDTIYLNKLSNIADKYKQLGEFIVYSMGKLGTIESGKLTVSPSVNKELTNDLVNRITEHDLQQFDNVERLKKLLTNPDWEQILQHADAKRSRDAWLEAKDILEALSKSDYVSASSFQTYEDVVNFGYEAYIPVKPGYDIDVRSKVTSITVNGQPVPDDAYFKRHSNVQFTFDAEYKYRKSEPVDVPTQDFDTEYDSNNQEENSSDTNDDENTEQTQEENEEYEEDTSNTNEEGEAYDSNTDNEDSD